ncbi:MAG: FtsX-like permease family protein [Bacteroidales bacterium]|nr:FtsX-like permease family protein [Bacteroidales bacterium]
MHAGLYIARRYFFSRKRRTVVNVISWISLAGIAVSTAALVVVLSVYNGIGEVTQGLFNAFDAPLVVQPAKGKTLHATRSDLDALRRVDGVAAVAQVVQENAWMTYRHNEAIVALRGVDGVYHRVTGLDTLLYEGTYRLADTVLTAADEEGVADTAVLHYLLMGAEVYYNLGVRDVSNVPVAVHIPKRGAALGLTMQEAFNTGYALPGGNFYIQQDIDNRYVVTDIAFVRSLMDYAPDECTQLCLGLAPDAKPERVKERVRALLGDGYRVMDRFEQQPIYYKVFRSERLGIYLILALIVLISTLNLVASLSLLMMDKRHDAATLRAMGMEGRAVRRIFRIEGLMISGLGVLAGLLLGFIVCFVQQRFGIIKMGSNFVVSAFPVAMRGVDFLNTTVMVTALSGLAVLFAVRKTKI